MTKGAVSPPLCLQGWANPLVLLSAAEIFGCSNLQKPAQEFLSLPLRAHRFCHSGFGLIYFSRCQVGNLHLSDPRCAQAQNATGRGTPESAWCEKKHLSKQELQLLPVLGGGNTSGYCTFTTKGFGSVLIPLSKPLKQLHWNSVQGCILASSCLWPGRICSLYDF